MELDVHLVPFGGGFKIIEGNEYDGPYDDKSNIFCVETEEDFEMKGGLYDPVLDDTDVIYEPLDQGDFDQPSRPTEVDLDLLNGLPEFLDCKERELTESRSVTVSPFLCPTKPYRPFSTEPIPAVPELEEPIILNPEYQDVFDQLGIDEDLLPKTKFKLPVSEQYDPDGTKKVKDGKDIKDTVERKEENVLVSENKECILQEKTVSSVEQIEKTASSIVDESIAKAVIVAEEIKKETDVAFWEASITSSEKTADSYLNLQSKQIVDSKVTDTKTNETAILTDKRSEEILSNENKIDVKVTKEKFESLSKQQTEVESKSPAKQEIKETIKAGTVKSKTTVYDKVSEAKETQKKDTIKKSVDENKAKTNQKDAKEKVTKTKTTQSSTKTSGSKTSGTKTKTNAKTKSSQERSYFIGLQTIPNIRGTINSNYHFDMLLKTFLVHLTDVMVALSRFILTDPGQLKFVDGMDKCTKCQKEETEENIGEEEEEEKDEEQEEELQEEVVTETVSQAEILETEVQEQELQQKVDVHSIKQSFEDQQVKYSATTQENITSVDETHEKRHISGCEMALMTDTSSEELIHKLSAVINEFETKTGIETTDSHLVTLAERRSRSRSRSKGREVEPAVLATTVVEAANKIMNETQETSNLTTSIASHVSSSFHSQDVKKTESTYEAVENTSMQDAKTYVAVVEAHVYANKDAILEQQVSELSTASSVKSSSVEETNLSSVTNAAVENIAVKSLEFENSIAKPALCEAEEAFLDKTSSKLETASTKIEEEKVFLDKTSSKIDSEIIIETKEAVQEKLVKPVQKARIVKGILKHAKNELKSDASKEINQVAETKSSVIEQSVSSYVESKTESIKAESKSEESAALKITKEKATEVQQVTKQLEELRDIQKKIEISEEASVLHKSIESYESKKTEENFTSETFSSETFDQECSFMAKSVDQESTFTIKTVDTVKIDEKSATATEITQQVVQKEDKKLTLNTEIPLKKSDSLASALSEKSTPTPATVPPTPLTDEYMFKLLIPLPPEPEVPIPRDCTPSDSEDEDPHIVKKGLIPHIDTEIEEGVVYETPLKSPPGSPVTPKVTPVYTKPGLRGGGDRRELKKEEILEIERKSSLLTSAIDQTIKSIEEYKEEVGLKQNGIDKTQAKTKKPGKMTFEAEINVENCPYPNVLNGEETNETRNVLEGYRPVQFNPEELQNARRELKSAMVSNGQVLQNQKVRQPYRTESGEIIGTHQGIVDGLDKAIVDETSQELGKPGMTEEKIAELISGESEMLREAHVMGLCRVLSTKMHRPTDDSSVDFKKIKPVIESLNHSEVLKALNEELMRTKEEKKKEERKWTTFMQKPQRPVPRVKFGYAGYAEQEFREQETYKPKIVKQPKPKVAPDYKPEVFETGLLPWEERALREPTPPPVPPEEPILIPEEQPEILEAVDPLPESQVPDLEDSGIPLPSPKTEEDQAEEEEGVDIEELDIEAVVEETEKIVEENVESLVEEMETGNVAEQLMASVQNMVDPNAPLEQQLSQMRAQLAALAQLPGVIQQSLEMVTKQLSQFSTLESQIKSTTAENASEVTQEDSQEIQSTEAEQVPEEQKQEEVITEQVEAVPEPLTAEELERMRQEEEAMLEEQRKMEKQRKAQMEQARLEQESRQIKQRTAPRVGKPTPAFGPATPIERPIVLTGGRKWRKPQDAYNEQFIAETLAAQAEIIRGKAKGLSYESVLLPYDERINFMKYEKPPVSLDHLQESETYKLIHNMESKPLRSVETLTSQICEADYRQKCRSITPCTERMAKEEHLDYPQQVQP